MIFIGIVAFSVVCSILKIRIESFLFAFPFMMIAAYFFFSGGPFWIATGIATSTLLGGPRPDEDSFVVFCRYPMFNAKYGFIFDIIGAICIIVGLIKVFKKLHGLLHKKRPMGFLYGWKTFIDRRKSNTL